VALFSVYARWLAFQNEKEMHKSVSAGEKATRTAALPIEMETMAQSSREDAISWQDLESELE
jgi:hypothetical protein